MFAPKETYLVPIRERTLLNKTGSDIECYHLVLDLRKTNAHYRAGDCIGLFVENEKSLVEHVLTLLNATGQEEICRDEKNLPFHEFLTKHANLSQLPPPWRDPSSESLDVISYLEKNPSQYSPTQLAALLLPLHPRFYSIASSMDEVGHELHLLVKVVKHVHNGLIKWGTASSFLCHSCPVGSSVLIYFVQGRDFCLPQEPKPIIMIGAGTGIAPFRAFMQERARKALPNWLIFGERRRLCDFYYEDFWHPLVQSGKLKLDLAFSRDQEEKIYVQHKMKERSRELWQWIESGAHLFVCGSASKMGKAVDATLHEIIAQEGKMSEEKTREYVRHLRREKRYLRDIY